MRLLGRDVFETGAVKYPPVLLKWHNSGRSGDADYYGNAF